MSKVLIIEDNEKTARLSEKLLKKNGYEVQIADEGEKGFMMAMETPPDIILLDLGLPDVDGQTLIGILRQQSQLNTVPIIAFTAWPPDTADNMVKAYGCDGFITKPIDTRQFASQVASFIVEATEKDEKTENTTTSSSGGVSSKEDTIVKDIKADSTEVTQDTSDTKTYVSDVNKTEATSETKVETTKTESKSKKE